MEFAQSLGLKSHSAISEAERHQKEPSRTILRQIVDIYDIDDGWLYTGKEPGTEVINNTKVFKRGEKGEDAVQEVNPGYYPEGINAPNITGIVQDALRLVAIESNKRGLDLDDYDRLTVVPGVAQDFAFSVPETRIRSRVNEIFDAIESRRPNREKKRPEG